MSELDSRRRKLASFSSRHALAARRCVEEAEALNKAEAQLDDVSQAQAIVQEVAEGIQNMVHRQIASVVSRCLESVFGIEAYSFKIKFSRKRGKTEAELLFVRDGQEIDPLDASGGGAVDVASFALRLACLFLSRPRKRLLIVADEPFRFLSREYRPAIRHMLEALAKEFGVQFIIVTHSQELRIGKVIEL